MYVNHVVLDLGHKHMVVTCLQCNFSSPQCVRMISGNKGLRGEPINTTLNWS